MIGRAVYNVAEEYDRKIGVKIKANDLRRTCAKLSRRTGGKLEQIHLLLGHASIQTTERYLGTTQDLENAPNDHLGPDFSSLFRAMNLRAHRPERSAGGPSGWNGR